MNTSVHFSRRTFVQRLALLSSMGAVGAVLAGCGNDQTSSTPSATATVPAPITSVIQAPDSTVATNSDHDSEPTPTIGFVLTGKKDGTGPEGYSNFGDITQFSGKKRPTMIKVDTTVAYVFSGEQMYIYNTICTHQGCIVQYDSTDNEFECPCHGSKYDPMGKVIHGPAKNRLALLTYQVINGQLYVKA